MSEVKLAKLKSTKGLTGRIKTSCGTLYVTLNFSEGKPYEVFSRLGKGGGCFASQMEALSRVISKAIQAGEDVNEIVDQLKGIRCPQPTISEGTQVYSCADGMSKVLAFLLEESKKSNEKESESKK